MLSDLITWKEWAQVLWMAMAVNQLSDLYCCAAVVKQLGCLLLKLESWQEGCPQAVVTAAWEKEAENTDSAQDWKQAVARIK